MNTPANRREYSDPLLANPQSANPVTPDRLFYAAGILLDAEDFRAEQLYHRSRLARTLAYLHGSGTVAGLSIVWEPEGEEELVVEPGLAIDRLGRLIEVPRRVCIRLNRWFEDQTDDTLTQSLKGPPYNGIVVDVFVHFVTCERGKTPALAAGPFDALDAVQPSRLRDGYEVKLVSRPEADPPLPVRSWPDLGAIASLSDRRQTLHEAILNGWQRETVGWDDNGPVGLPEHVANQNPTAVFLARVVIPATGAGDRPERTPEAEVTVDNLSRNFVYAAGALASWLGAVLPRDVTEEPEPPEDPEPEDPDPEDPDPEEPEPPEDPEPEDPDPEEPEPPAPEPPET